MPYALNYKQDPPDSLDRIYQSRVDPDARAGSLQSIVIPEYTPISQQGGLGSCVANAVCDAFELMIGARMLAGEPVPQLSRIWLYAVSRRWDGTYPADVGTYVRTALRQGSKVGICLESDCPYIELSQDKPFPTELNVRASENRIHEYRRIASTGYAKTYQVRQAIAEGKPVVFGTILGSEFRDPGRNEVLDVPTDAIGGHAMVIVGWRKNLSTGKFEFRLRNSWGTAWGDNGYVWVTEDYMAWDRTTDLWVITDSPDVI